MIDRRAFVAGATAAGLLWSIRVVGAPAPGRVYRIGVLEIDPDDSIGVGREFVAELARRGYVEGRNLVIERRVGEVLRPDRINELARELAALKVDVLYADSGTPGALALKNATKTIPIVFYSSADPIGFGLVASLSHPGGNLTGGSASPFYIDPKGLQFLVQALGRKSFRIAEIQPRGTQEIAWFSKWSAVMISAAGQLGIKYEFVDVDSVTDIEPVLKRLVREGVEAVRMESHPQFRPHLQRIAALLIDYRLPSIGDPRAGFLLDYQADQLQLARSAAERVDKILTGASPADLPVEQVSTFRLVINEKTAKAIGLQLPPSILQRADEVIR